MARILIADDDPEIRDSLVKLLGLVGHDVSTVENGHEAMELLDVESFDLLITDILMPRRDGLECVMHVRKNHADMPVLAISGGARTDTYLKLAETMGAAKTFHKPFPPRELMAKVAELVGETPQPA